MRLTDLFAMMSFLIGYAAGNQLLRAFSGRDYIKLASDFDLRANAKITPRHTRHG